MNEMMMLAGLVVVSIVLVTYSLWPKGSEDEAKIKRRIHGRSGRDEIADIRKRAKESVAKQMLQKVAPIAVRAVAPKKAEEMSKLRLKLAKAGFRSENASTIFLASKSIVAVFALIVGVAYAVMKGSSLNGAFGQVIFFAAIGFMAPNIWLSMAAGKRAEKIKNGVPDALDLMVISVESGLALDAAILRVGDEMKNVHPSLSEEMQLVTMESQMGIPRAEALMNMADRTGVPEMRSLVAIVNQAERFGTSIARALRTQADTLRMKRRQAAEERAQSTTVKLMAPLILFIFPAILVVLGGPAGLKMIETMRQNPAIMGTGQ